LLKAILERIERNLIIGGGQMFPHALSHAGVPTGVLDMTAEFAPLLHIIIIGLGLCVLGLAVATGIHDTLQAQRKAAGALAQPESLPKAAEAAFSN
jgi:hypothetical protein